MPAPRRLELALAGSLFFLSGACALVYQVAWQRILALHTGVGIYSVAVIVAAFMAGLGLGSHLGGVWSARVDPRAALLRFAVAELAVAALGAVSAPLYYDLLYVKAAGLYASPWSAGAMHFLALLPPTTLMGLSLPLLVRGLVRDAETASRTIGTLYGVNVLGAAAGAFAAPWLLIRHYGLDGAVLWAAAGNAVVGVAGFALRRRLAGGTETAVDRSAALAPHDPMSHDPARRDARGAPFALWMALYATSGFVALSLEILWFRIVDVAVRSTAFTFGTVLGTYLLGMGCGCLWAAGHAHRVTRPLRTFLLCQAALLAYAAAALILLTAVPTTAPLYRWYFAYWGDVKRHILGFGISNEGLVKLYVLVPLLLFGVPTALMGYSFPVLQRAVQDDVASSGRKVGLLQAANIAGCTAGSLVVGLALLSAIGTTGSLRVLLAIGAGMALVGVWAGAGRRALWGAAAVLLVLAVAVPSPRRFWLRLHGTTSAGPGLVGEDASGLGALVPAENGWRVHVNGKVHSWLPFGGIHTTFGAVPAMVHPAPEEIAIVGLGSGDTAWAAACRPATRRLTVFEIVRPLPRLLRELARRETAPDLRALLRDPRLDLVIADGRNALERGAARYDFIQADPLWPETGYSGNLYSREFYERCAARLKPDGFMCAWVPTARTRATFSSVFPHVLLSGQIAIGSFHEIPVQKRRWRERLEDPAVAAYLGPERAEHVLLTLQALRPVVRLGLAPNRDLYPRDEFAAP